MKPITFKAKYNTVDQALGISPARVRKLEFRCSLILHEQFKPRETEEEYPSSEEILKLFISLAENEQELVYLSYLAGMKVQELYVDYEPDEFYEEED